MSTTAEELKAMRSIYKALAKLDLDAAQRVLDWNTSQHAHRVALHAQERIEKATALTPHIPLDRP